MKILFVASECAPIAKVGGLADVIGSLPKTLKNSGIDVSIVIPFYGSIERKDDLILFKKDLRVNFDGKEQSFDLWLTHLEKIPVFLIKNDHYFSGGIYVEKDASSGGSEKEAARFPGTQRPWGRPTLLLPSSARRARLCYSRSLPRCGPPGLANRAPAANVHGVKHEDG